MFIMVSFFFIESIQLPPIFWSRSIKMKLNILGKTFSVLLISSLVTFNASAVSVSCSDAAGLDCVATRGDVLAGGLEVPNSGNDMQDVVEAAIEIATGSFMDIVLHGKSDDDPSLYSFSNFDQGNSLTDSQSGSWALNDTSIGIDFVTVKAANSFVVLAVNGATSGIYSTEGILNNGGQQPDVSHISFWTKDGNSGVGGDTDMNGDGEEVPEPGTIALLALGLIGVSAFRSKHKA